MMMFHELHQSEVRAPADTYKGESMTWFAECSECGGWFSIGFTDAGIARAS